MELELREFTRHSRCDINKCRERARISIGNAGGPASTRFNICLDDLGQIVRKGAALLKIELADPELLKQLEEKDKTIERLQMRVDELSKQDATGEQVEKQQSDAVNSGSAEDLELMKRSDLIKLASSIGVPGKLVTMGKEELIAKIGGRRNEIGDGKGA